MAEFLLNTVDEFSFKIGSKSSEYFYISVCMHYAIKIKKLDVRQPPRYIYRGAPWINKIKFKTLREKCLNTEFFLVRIFHYPN